MARNVTTDRQKDGAWGFPHSASCRIPHQTSMANAKGISTFVPSEDHDMLIVTNIRVKRMVRLLVEEMQPSENVYAVNRWVYLQHLNIVKALEI
jgi:hypothetical protein